MLAAGPFGLGPMELVIILLVLVMLFGATRLADIGGSLGKGIKEFRREIAADDDEKPAQTQNAPAEPAATPIVSTPVAMTNGGVETVSAVKCPSCGALNTVGSKFCNQCSASIVAPVS
jgi:sec-independent protein translocase protein TatA